MYRKTWITWNKIYPLLAINEMCNYITACCCHLENWYFVTHKLFSSSLSLLTFVSFFIVYVKLIYAVKITRKKNGSSLHRLLHRLSVYISFAMWVVTDLFQYWHSAEILLSWNGVVDYSTLKNYQLYLMSLSIIF